MRRQHRFQFKPTVVFADAEKILQLALFATGGVHGQAAIRLHVTYERDPANRTIEIDTSTAIGEEVARVFVELLTREVGEHGFAITELDECEGSWPPHEGAGVT